MTDAAELLEQVGFSEYEARAYITLLGRSPLNGYELAKESGIPRANIYAILQRLEERNAVVRVDMEGSIHYAPVPPDELIPQLGNRFQNVLDDAQRSLAAISATADSTLSRNILGRSSLIEQVEALIDAAQCDLILALWYPETQVLVDSLTRAEQRGIHITTLCLQACPAPCKTCRGAIYRYRVLPTEASRWLMVIRDSQEMVMGEIGADEATATRTGQHCLVQMAIQYIRSSIAWAALLQNSDQGLDKILPTETQRILSEIGPNGSWLTYMRQLLHDGSNN